MAALSKRTDPFSPDFPYLVYRNAIASLLRAARGDKKFVVHDELASSLARLYKGCNVGTGESCWS
jgi:hypothetical protein